MGIFSLIENRVSSYWSKKINQVINRENFINAFQDQVNAIEKIRSMAKKLQEIEDQRDLYCRELESSLNEFKALVSLISDWVFKIDQDGRYTFIDEKIEKLYGFKVSDIIGSFPHDCVTEEFMEAIKGFEDRILMGKTHPAFKNLKVLSYNSKRDKIGTLVSAVPIFEGDRFSGYIGIETIIPLDEVVPKGELSVELIK